MRDRRRRIALLVPDPAQEPVRAVGAAVLGEEIDRRLEVLGRLCAAPFPEQGLSQRHAGSEAAGVARDLGLQSRDVGCQTRPHRAAPRSAPRPPGLAAHRRQRGGEAVPQEHVEILVEVLQPHAERPVERLFVGGAVPVGAQHLDDRREPVSRLDQLEYQRRLVVALDHLARMARAGEPLVELADRSHLARRERPDEPDPRLMAPPGIALALLVHGKALGEPPRHLVPCDRQVERVRDLVPERRGPVEVAPTARRRGVDGERRPEADAQRPDPHQPYRPHREVGVAGVDLDPDPRLGRLAVPLSHIRVRPLGHGHHVRREQVGLRLVQHQVEVRRLDDAVVRKGIE